MQKHVLTNFGFQRLVINAQFHVWTCKMSFERTKSPLPVIRGVSLSFSQTTSKKGKITEKVILKYCTMEYAEHERMQKEIMLFAEEHAIRIIKDKYAWLHIPSEKELTLEEALPEW